MVSLVAACCPVDTGSPELVRAKSYCVQSLENFHRRGRKDRFSDGRAESGSFASLRMTVLFKRGRPTHHFTLTFFGFLNGKNAMKSAWCTMNASVVRFTRSPSAA